MRDQVPTLIGISAWLLFVERLLIGDVAGPSIADIGRFAPGALGMAASGQDLGTLLTAARPPSHPLTQWSQLRLDGGRGPKAEAGRAGQDQLTTSLPTSV